MPPERPTTPTFTTAAAGDGFIKVTWGQSERANHYAIKRRIVGSETQYWDQKTQPASEARLFIDRNVLNGKSYQYQVVAINESGDSEPATTAQVTPASQVQPDGMVRTEAEGALAMSRGAQGRALPGSLWDGYSGNDIYNTVGTKQERSLSVLRNSAAVYQVRVQNDGKVNDIIKVTAPASGGGWVIRYRDIILGTDITDAITNQDVLSGGYRLGLKPGAYRDLSITVTPSGIVPIGTVKEVALTLVSTNNAKRLDVVRTLTTVISTEAQIVVHPQASDFKPGMAGRIMVSALQDAPADKYYTTAQTADGKVTVTANLSVPDQPASAAANKRVYFRVLDPDDASPYEPDTDGDDNKEAMKGYPPVATGLPPKGVLSGQNAQGVASVLSTIAAGQQTATARIELAFNHASGNNYEVEASLDPTFPEGKTSRSMVMVAWKRVYVEVDEMYKKGATVTAPFEPDADDQPDVLTVDNARATADGTTADIQFGKEEHDTGLLKGSDIQLFVPDPNEETGLRIVASRKILDKTATTITVADLDVPLKQFTGVRLPNAPETYTVSLDLVPKAYGLETNGGDGGVFTEIKFGAPGSGVAPRFTTLTLDNDLAINFSQFWLRNGGNGNGIIHLMVAWRFDRSFVRGYAFGAVNASQLYTANHLPWSAEEVKLQNAEVAVHEIGHHFELFTGFYGHVDLDVPGFPNHDGGKDQCIMSYGSKFRDGIAEFDVICLNHIRQTEIP